MAATLADGLLANDEIDGFGFDFGQSASVAFRIQSTLLCFSVDFTSLASAVTAQSAPVPSGFDLGECVTGRINFDPSRAFTLQPGVQGEAQRFTLDRSKYDFTIDYNPANLQFVPSGVELSFLPPKPNATGPGANLASGVRMSSTMYFKYAKISAKFTPIAEGGAVSTFITWSDALGQASNGGGATEEVHDEIDWEILGNRVFAPQFNVFTYLTKNLERSAHGGPIPGSVSGSGSHVYTIDWRSSRIDFIVDDKIYHTTLKSTERATTAAAQMGNTPWFPTKPSRLQFSIWTPSSTWGGGPLRFNGRPKISTVYEWIDVQCYDDKDQPVARWSAADVPVPPAAATTTAVPAVAQVPVMSNLFPTATVTSVNRSGARSVLGDARASTLAVALAAFAVAAVAMF
eukprot:jgi/Hompol1/6829/HPOL_000297-RA